MNTTINISLPKSMYADAKDVVRESRYTSISELIRHALRDILYPSGLTVNGFTPEFEDMALKSAASPTRNDIVFRNDKDLKNYFLYLKYPSKMKSRDGKSSAKRGVRPDVSKLGR